MRGLRLTELYPSIQGEGPRTGMPTIFVRFGGCNMRCPGWPCDTPQAIFPDQWRKDPVVQPFDLTGRISGLPGINVCITGGEPFMQPPEMLEELVDHLLDLHYTIDLFTNGSFEFPDWITDSRVSMIMDWKLTGSGEATTNRTTRRLNLAKLKSKDNVKFVVASEDDFDEAAEWWQQLNKETPARFWVGAAWERFDEARIVERVLDHNLPWRVNVQVHKFIWPGIEKGI